MTTKQKQPRRTGQHQAAVQARRRSSAAGTHQQRPTRRDERQHAITDQRA
ncbi:MAG: hypothetical protein L0I76_30980 [Pseudonocardia sp.]|nr:hypothetical protein [Pseudonocardia sp.]